MNTRDPNLLKTHTYTGQWMLTASGREYLLSGPCVLMQDNAPRIEDIAHALSLINRFCGHTLRPYSVAEHSLLCAEIAKSRGNSRTVQLAALMHDAHEAFVGDLTSPAKWAMGAAWIGFEAPHIANLRAHFGLKTVFASARAEIKQCDLIALATERRDLTAFDPAVHAPWPILDTLGSEVMPLQDVDLNWETEGTGSWQWVRDLFTAKFMELSA